MTLDVATRIQKAAQPSGGYKQTIARLQDDTARIRATGEAFKRDMEALDAKESK